MSVLTADTHLIGTLRKNRTTLPKSVVDTKLKTDEYIARESTDGITFMKSKGKRDLLNTIGYQRIVKMGNEKIKPKIVLAYNRAKSSIDLSDQLTLITVPLYVKQ